ncbi:hypothetical protein, partial [Salmonella enterica]|uniref:hypothetical protein n=1 Tax=Salmonella enterica TaxID=28901 RepID=UPI00139D8862
DTTQTTVLGTTAVLSPAVASTIALIAAPLVTLYGITVGSKNAIELSRALRTRKLCVLPADDPGVQNNVKDYNHSVGIERWFYGLHSGACLVYLVGAGWMLAVLAGTGAATQGAAIGLAIGGGLSAIFIDALYKRRRARSLGFLPHIDR